jgi:hypothetical protein
MMMAFFPHLVFASAETPKGKSFDLSLVMSEGYNPNLNLSLVGSPKTKISTQMVVIPELGSIVPSFVDKDGHKDSEKDDEEEDLEEPPEIPMERRLMERRPETDVDFLGIPVKKTPFTK